MRRSPTLREINVWEKVTRTGRIKIEIRESALELLKELKKPDRTEAKPGERKSQKL